MGDNWKSLSRTLYLNGALAAIALTLVVHYLLHRVAVEAGSADPGSASLPGTVAFLVVAVVAGLLLVRWVAARLVRPLDSAEVIATRVAAGNLTISDLSIDQASRNGGQVIVSLGTMV